MRITALTGYNNFSSLKPKQNLTNITFTNAQTTPLTEDDFNNAKKYCRTRCQELGLNFHIRNISNYLTANFNFHRLNGMQYGIKVFDGMTMKEIALSLNKLSILINRNCSNLCSHCFVNALPRQRLQGVTSFTYEDFEEILKGISQLNQVFQECGFEGTPFEIYTLYLDSDCMEIEMPDKNGKTYDIIDCFKLLDKYSIDSNGLFGTHGWTPSFKKHQGRAEKLVRYLKEIYKDNNIQNKPIKKVIVSINPCHALLEKYNELKSSNKNKAEKFRNLYINRMANTLYTFSPLLDIKGLDYILNILSANSNSTYDDKVVKQLVDDILKRLTEIYKEKNVAPDLQKNYIDKYNQTIKDFTDDSLFRSGTAYRPIGAGGRANSLLPDNEVEEYKSMLGRYCSSLSNMFPSARDISDQSKVVEPNGEVQLVAGGSTIRTDVQFNLGQKGLPCPLLGELYSQHAIDMNLTSSKMFVYRR